MAVKYYSNLSPEKNRQYAVETIFVTYTTNDVILRQIFNSIDFLVSRSTQLNVQLWIIKSDQSTVHDYQKEFIIMPSYARRSVCVSLFRRHRPTVHTMPTSFHAKCQKFTDHLGKCGMYRNQSLNTAMDKSIV